MGSELDGFYATWSQARETYGQGTPVTGERFDASSTLTGLQTQLDAAAPGDRWSGAASESYGTANSRHQQTIGRIAELDRKLAGQVTNAANIVSTGRTNLDELRTWVTDAAATTTDDEAGRTMRMQIASRGLAQLTEIMTGTHGEIQTVKGNIDKLAGEYDAVKNDIQFLTGEDVDGDGKPDDEDGEQTPEEKQAEEDVRRTLEGDQEAAGRVDEVLRGIAPYEPLTSEEAAYLHEMQVQQQDMSVQDIHAAQQQLGDHENVIGDSWQLMSNDDVKYDNPDKPGEQVVGSRDQLPTSVKSAMSLGTIADDFNRTGETEIRGMAEIIKDGRVELQTGTEVDRGMIELSDRLMDNPTPINQQAVLEIFDGAGRDHQIITDQLLGRNEGTRDDFLQNINTIDWSDGGQSAGELFSWTHDTTGPDAAIAAQTADQYADYIGRHPELLSMADFGNETLGQRNPELVQAYAHGLTPYMADIAGVGGENHFPDLDNGVADRPLAKNLFAVLGTDQEAYVEFNGAADQLGLDKAYSWAEDVKRGDIPSSTDPRMSDAAILKGLVDVGTERGVLAMYDNANSALEWRQLAYDQGVSALSSLGGPVGGPLLSVFGSEMQSSIIGGQVGGEWHPPGNISPDEASRFMANALISSGVDLDIGEQYRIGDHVASPQELNAASKPEPTSTDLQDALTRALTPVMGDPNPTALNFQAWYNQTISGE